MHLHPNYGSILVLHAYTRLIPKRPILHLRSPMGFSKHTSL